MTAIGKAWPPSSILLGSAGVAVAGIGIFFMFFRPPLLAEDVLYMQLSAAELVAIGSRLELWLTQVFCVLGGYALATDLLIIALAATAFRARHPLAVFGAITAGVSSIGLMVMANFALDSRFKWFLLGVALSWLLSMVVFAVEERALRSASPRLLTDNTSATGLSAISEKLEPSDLPKDSL